MGQVAFTVVLVWPQTYVLYYCYIADIPYNLPRLISSQLPWHCPLFLFLTPSSGGHPTVPDKVQELAESLQQISGQLNTVLGALGSLAQRQSVTPYTAFPLPLSQPHSSTTPTSAPVMPQKHNLGHSPLAAPHPMRLSEPSWAWAPQGSSSATPFFSTPISSGLRASEDLINSRWSQIFPSMLTCTLNLLQSSKAGIMRLVKKFF